MTYEQFRKESESIADIYKYTSLNDLTFASLASMCHEYRDLVNKMLSYLEVNNAQEVEQRLLSQVRGVFKYRTKSNSKGYSHYTSNKYDLVQVGYLDLEDNIIFNEVQRPISELDQYSITRYLPGFHIRQYNSCEEYVPKLDSSKEVKEVISSEIVEYSLGSYNSKKEIYSVIGFLNSENQFIQYDQITE